MHLLRFTCPSRITLLVVSGMLAACAADGGSGNDPWADAGSRRAPAAERPAAAGAGGAAGARSAEAPAAEPGTVAETARPAGKVEWVAVYESPPGTRYNEQRVIYVDRNSVEPHALDKLTYYLARTREVSRAGAKPKIQEIAVLCEGAPIAPATSLRGEGTEESGGSYSLKRAATPITSISQFSTQRLRVDANNPNTFIVRAVCMLGTGG
jgi:hypothetical protein